MAEFVNEEVNGSVPFHPAGMPVTEPMRHLDVHKEAVDMTSFESDNIHPVTSIKAAKEDLTIPLGATIQLQIIPEPFIGNIPDLVWETSDYSIIHFHQEINAVPGMIEGLKVGKATVTATNPLDNSQTITWNITVVNGLEKSEEGDENTEPEESTNE